jgi:hypothetical protein
LRTLLLASATSATSSTSLPLWPAVVPGRIEAHLLWLIRGSAPQHCRMQAGLSVCCHQYHQACLPATQVTAPPQALNTAIRTRRRCRRNDYIVCRAAERSAGWGGVLGSSSQFIQGGGSGLPPSPPPRQKTLHEMLSRVRAFEGLQSDDFRHPLDQSNTTLLKSLPGLEVVAKTMLGESGGPLLVGSVASGGHLNRQ